MKWQIFIFSILVGCAFNDKKISTPSLEANSLESFFQSPIYAENSSSRIPANEKNPLSGYYDGCYQLYKQGALHPVICIDGTLEEGIGGAGVRLFLLHANSEHMIACGKSSSVRMTINSFEYEMRGVKELILSNLKKDDANPSLVVGEAHMGNTKLDFIFIGQKQSSELLQIAYKNVSCQNVNNGEIRRL